MHKSTNPSPQPRHDTIKSHLIDEHRHDPYKASGKLPEPAACPDCGAVFANGRWQWQKPKPEAAEAHICPACQRSHDNYPAGELILIGAFVANHADEILGLARNIEASEKAEHPLQRIMAVRTSDGLIVITTTDIHLPRRIAHAIAHAYKGELSTHYDEGSYFARFTWQREA